MKKLPRVASKNNITVEHLNVACRHVIELMAVGVTENFAIRNLELYVDVYANSRHSTSATPHHHSKVSHWSIAALAIREKFGERIPSGLVRVEHGTPKRALAREILNLHRAGQLDQAALAKLVDQNWRLAVITIDEDTRLNKVARSKMHNSPFERWAAAGIVFPSTVLPQVEKREPPVHSGKALETSSMPRRSGQLTHHIARSRVEQELRERGYNARNTGIARSDFEVTSPNGTVFHLKVLGLYKSNPWMIKKRSDHAGLIYVFAYVPDAEAARFFVLSQDQVNRYVEDGLQRLGRAADYPAPGVTWKQVEGHEGAWTILPP